MDISFIFKLSAIIKPCNDEETIVNYDYENNSIDKLDEENTNKNISNLIITCQDTGKGIKSEYINRLFTKSLKFLLKSLSKSIYPLP